MRLAYDIANTLPMLRREAEGRMVDTCRLSHRDGEPTFDPITGEWTSGTLTPYYEGPCEIQTRESLIAQTVDSGQEEITVSRVTLKVPVSVAGVRVGDVAEILAATWDDELVGAQYRVTANHAKTYATTRRLPIERVET